MNRVVVILLGLFARILQIVIPLKKKHWVFGADYGQSYKEGSKYLIEYMYKYHPDYDCVFITSSPKVLKQVRGKGIKCYSNYSIKGLISICKAECVFTTQYISDILFVYKKNNRRFFYVLHGMPYKLAADALPSFVRPKPTFFNKLNMVLAKAFLVGYDLHDVDFVSVTSDYLVKYEQKDLSYKVPVKVLGMPRNDALFDDIRMKSEQWLDNLQGKFIISYMPTHRKYGEGEPSPTIFIDNEEYQNWLRNNNAVVLIKQHPNMVSKLKDVKQSDVIIDITSLGIDPQVCIYHSDILITDYSSVWMDYLLLKRPLVFYYYDDFEKEDAGTHYSINEIKPGHFCYNEEELFELVKKAFLNYDDFRPSERVVNMFHKYVDGQSCKRYFDEITK